MGIPRTLFTVVLYATLITGCDSSGDSPPPRDDGHAPDGFAADATVTTDGSNSLDSQLADAGLAIDLAVTDVGVDLDAQSTEDLGHLDAAVIEMDAGGPMLMDGGIADAELVGCVTPISQLEWYTWPLAFANNCTGCHLPGGAADRAGVGFVLHDPENPDRESRADAIAHNLERIIAVSYDEMGTPYILRKATGATNHGGQMALTVGTEGYDSLVRLLEIIERGDDPDCTENSDDVPGYREIFGRISQRDAQQTWRAFTVQTMGRLPTHAEIRRIRSGQDLQVGANPGNNMRPGANGDDGRAINASANNQLRTAHSMIAESLGNDETKSWIKDMWNDVFMFRGIHAQELDRAYEVYNGWDYGARHWSDMCDIKVFETDENGDLIIGPARQPMCNLQYDRFGFTEVLQPNHDGSGYANQAVLSPIEACDFCRYTRRGLAEFMLYGEIEAPLELIANTIQRDRPFTEILTTEDIMMNYYTSLVHFGTSDPMANDFTADMDDVPVMDALRNGPNWVIFDVDLPDHRAFKRFDRMRRTRQIIVTHQHDRVDENGDVVLDEDGEPEQTDGQMRYFVYQNEHNPQEPDSFPRSGILTSPAFMTRYPSNEFNLHRHRAWQTLRLLLDYDILGNQGERVSLANVPNPNGGATVDPNNDCFDCHVQLDPVSGLFKDFGFSGASKRPGVADSQWPEDIHAPGWPDIDGNEVIIHNRDVHGHPIQFLAQRIIESPRFPKAMVKYAWRQVLGHDPLGIAGDPSDDNFAARSTLLMAQSRFFDGLVNGFVSRGFDMKFVYQRLFTSVWYRAKGLVPSVDEGIPDSIYEGIGRYGPLTPEEYFRRLEALYGGPWPLNAIPISNTRAVTQEERHKRTFFTRTDSHYENFDKLIGMLDASFASLFGGIDFQNSLTRAALTNSVMSLVARRVANEFSCLVVHNDLRKPPDERRFFPNIPAQRRGEVADEASVRRNLVYLFKMFLDHDVNADGEEVDIAWSLWRDARQSALDEVADDPVAGAYIAAHCRAHESAGDRPGMLEPDADGQVRAWMTVVTYLMLQPELLQR